MMPPNPAGTVRYYLLNSSDDGVLRVDDTFGMEGGIVRTGPIPVEKCLVLLSAPEAKLVLFLASSLFCSPCAVGGSCFQSPGFENFAFG